MLRVNNTSTEILNILVHQEAIVTWLSQFTTELNLSSTKEQSAKEWLSPSGKYYSKLGKFPFAIPLFLDSEFECIGISPNVKIFNSAQSPMLLQFIGVNGNKYNTIYKTSDLRQDQFIMHIIELMNLFLKKEGIDTQLYTV